MERYYQLRPSPGTVVQMRREGETLRMREKGGIMAVLIEVRDHNVDLNIIQVTTVSQGHKILMSGSPWKALGVDFMICKYNVLQQ